MSVERRIEVKSSGTVSRSIAQVLCIGAVIAGCTTHYGQLSVGTPIVAGDADTRAAMSRQADAIVKSAEAIEASRVNAFLSRQERISTQVRIGAEQLPAASQPAVDTTPPDLPELSTTHPPVPDSPISPVATGALFSEGLKDLQSKQAHIEGVRVLFKGNAAIDEDGARVYLVRFDVFVEPERQDYYTYLWRWLDFVKGLRNFTKDYLAEVYFVIPEIRLCGADRSIVELLAVEPANENVTEQDAISTVENFQLAAAYREAALAGDIDYANTLRQQFIEQRKFPLVQGVADSPRMFHFVLSPRQRIEEKAWHFPWTSRFTLERRLEPEVRSVYAYLLVRAVKHDAGSSMFSATAAVESLAAKFGACDARELLADASKLQSSVAANELTVPLVVCAQFKQLGDPATQAFIPFKSGDYAAVDASATDPSRPTLARVVPLRLPIDRDDQALAASAPSAREFSGRRIGVQWAGSRLALPKKPNPTDPTPAPVELETRAFDLSGTEYPLVDAGFDKATGTNLFVVDAPNATGPLTVRLRIRHDASDVMTNSVKLYAQRSDPQLDPQVASQGAIVTIHLALPNPGKIAKGATALGVQLGTRPAPFVFAPDAVDANAQSGSLEWEGKIWVPEAESSHVVNVTIVFKNVDGSQFVFVLDSPFVYAEVPECCKD